MNLFLGTDDGLTILEGQQEDWRLRHERLPGRCVTAVVATEQRAWVGTTDGLWCSLDGGETWSPSDTGLQVRHVRALAVHPGHGDASTPDLLLAGTEPAAIFLSHDGGQTWAGAPDVARLRDQHDWSLPYSEAAGCVRGFSLADGRFYAAAEVGGVLHSGDGGETWRLLGGSVHADVHDVARHPQDPGVIYAATGGGRYLSRDGGQTWSLIGAGYTRAVWVDPDRPEVVLTGPARYVGAMGRVERSTDGGQTWSLASDGFNVPMSDMIERFVGAGSHVLALTSDGALYAAKRGVWMWHQLEVGLSPVRAVAVR